MSRMRSNETKWSNKPNVVKRAATVRRFGLDGGSFDRNGANQMVNGPSRSNQMVKEAGNAWVQRPGHRLVSLYADVWTCLSLNIDVEMLSVHGCRNAWARRGRLDGQRGRRGQSKWSNGPEMPGRAAVARITAARVSVST